MRNRTRLRAFVAAGSVVPALSDAALPWQRSLQEPATPIARAIRHFHHDLMAIRVFVTSFVVWMIFRILTHFQHTQNPVPSTTVHGVTIEVIWTRIPAFILVLIAVPSFALLYAADELADPSLTVMVTGKQWYWTVAYPDYRKEDGSVIEFDSYMLPDDELVEGQLRLLEVDNRLVLPTDTHIRVIVTAADVLHCWTVPSFGVKLDACPGRLNQVARFITRPGTFYGQCSEICGTGHAVMPIAVDAVSREDYLTWVQTRLEE